MTKKSPYSIDTNIYGRAIECGVLEDPWKEPPEDIFALTKNPVKAPASLMLNPPFPMANETWSGFKNTSALPSSSLMLIEETLAGLNALDIYN